MPSPSDVRTLDDVQVLDRLAPLLTQLYLHGWSADVAAEIPPLMARARELGITHRHIASHARIPGRAVIDRLAPEDQPPAWMAEVHHAERALEAARLDRGRAAMLLLSGDAPMSKIAVAAAFGVSRPTLDKWLDQVRDTDGVVPQGSWLPLSGQS